MQPNLTGLRSSDIKKEQLCALYESVVPVGATDRVADSCVRVFLQELLSYQSCLWSTYGSSK